MRWTSGETSGYDLVLPLVVWGYHLRSNSPKAALSAAPVQATYARVDVLRGPDGAFQVMEMELIEPALFLDGNALAEEAFVNAVFAAAERTSARSQRG